MEYKAKRTYKEPGEWDERPIQWCDTLKALARLGEKEAVQECIRLVEALENPIDRVYVLEYLSYIRQPEIVEYLWGYLKSDEIEGGSRDVPPMPFSRRASNALASMLIGYPARASIEEKRAWMEEQTTWDILR